MRSREWNISIVEQEWHMEISRKATSAGGPEGDSGNAVLVGGVLRKGEDAISDNEGEGREGLRMHELVNHLLEMRWAHFCYRFHELRQSEGAPMVRGQTIRDNLVPQLLRKTRFAHPLVGEFGVYQRYQNALLYQKLPELYNWINVALCWKRK